MALIPITHTDPSPVPDAVVPQGDTAPAGAPNVDDKTPEEIASILEKMNQSGQPAAPVGIPSPLEDNKPPEEKPEGTPEEKPLEELQVPDKYKNSDGTTNWQNVLKSNLEQEKHLSQYFQTRSERDRLADENKQLMQLMEEAEAEVQQLRSAPQTSQLPGGQASMTEQQIEEYNANPDAYINKMLDQKLSKLNQRVDEGKKVDAQSRLLDFKINMAKTRAENDPAFAGLKEDAMKILNANIIDYDPRAIDLAFHAARSQKLPEIVAQAKNDAFTAGYNKHKEELSRQVEGGAGSTVPVGGTQINAKTLDPMTPEEMIQAGLVNVDMSK